MPAGICTIDSSESIPCSAFDSTGTPSTGRWVLAAAMPGQVGGAAGAGDDHLEPALGRRRAYSNSRSGVRWADTTRDLVRHAEPSSVSAAWRIVSQSDRDPMMTPTSGSAIVAAV